MSLEETRKRVLLLRASAAVLIDGAPNGWGLVQGLLELAEALVRESGQPAESFGKGGRTCCAACGECDGQHECWCIHAEDQATWGEPEFETPEQAATCKRSPFEGAADEPEPAEDAAASELLAWLDLSGLPPVPPEPPARRRQNWRFDGPEGGEHILF